jgi:hypothetical protein
VTDGPLDPAPPRPPRRAGAGSCLRALAATTLLAGLLGLSQGASRADEDVAKALLQSAKAAFDKKDYAAALTLLEQAQKEHGPLREVAYWLGATNDKLGQVQHALRAWREFRAALEADADSVTKAEADLLKKAQARLLVLAPGEAEGEKLRSAFAADLLAFAKARDSKDPVAAWQALDLLLKAEPGRVDAAAWAARLRSPPRPGESELPAPLAGLSGWTDMIAARWMGDSLDWKYGDHLITIDVGQQAVPGPPSPYPVGGRCALDMELRVLAVKVPTWGVGFALFDANDSQLVGVQVTAKSVAGFRGPPQGPLTRLAESPVAPIDLKSWHRLSVQVLAPKIVVFLDGKKITQFAADNVGPGTHLRLFVNRCQVELRTLRWVALP